MSDETRASDPVRLVLADLRSKREQIDQTIRMSELLRSGGMGGAAIGIPSATGGVELAAEDKDIFASAFLGMSLPEAAKKLLTTRRKPLTSAEIAAQLQMGGLIMNSADPVNTIGSVLTRRFNVVGDIVRVGRGVWGLASWYPNRSFKKKADKADEEET